MATTTTKKDVSFRLMLKSPKCLCCSTVSDRCSLWLTSLVAVKIIARAASVPLFLPSGLAALGHAARIVHHLPHAGDRADGRLANLHGDIGFDCETATHARK